MNLTTGNLAMRFCECIASPKTPGAYLESVQIPSRELENGRK
jgi:hypothetical protein